MDIPTPARKSCHIDVDCWLKEAGATKSKTECYGHSLICCSVSLMEPITGDDRANRKQSSVPKTTTARSWAVLYGAVWNIADSIILSATILSVRKRPISRGRHDVFIVRYSWLEDSLTVRFVCMCAQVCLCVCEWFVLYMPERENLPTEFSANFFRLPLSDGRPSLAASSTEWDWQRNRAHRKASARIKWLPLFQCLPMVGTSVERQKEVEIRSKRLPLEKYERG